MTTEQWMTLAALVGGTLGGRELVMGLWRWLSGRQRAQQELVARLNDELDGANAYRRALEELVAQQRQVMIANGIGHLMPPPPRRYRGEDEEG